MNILRLLFIVTLLALAGCESMSESECRVADWGRVGYADGAAGVQESRLADYTEDCGKAGIQPNPLAYRQGWDQGILRFCTAVSGWREGVLGHSGKDAVCQGRTGYEVFARYLALGLNVYASKQRIQENDAQINRLQKRLEDAATKDDEKRHIRDELRSIDREQFHLRSVLAQQNMLAP